MPEYVAHVRAFLGWVEARALTLPAITRADLQRYQAELFALRKPNGTPYSAGFQVNRLAALKSSGASPRSPTTADGPCSTPTTVGAT